MAPRKRDSQPDRQVDGLDCVEALRLRLDVGETYAQIGRRYGVSRQAVQKALKPLIATIEHPDTIEAYRQRESPLLDGVRMVLVEHLLDPERLAKASTRDLATAYGTLFNAARLLHGEATAVFGLRAAVIVSAHQREPEPHE